MNKRNIWIRSILNRVYFDERKMLENIFDYCQNEMLIRQGKDFEKDRKYQFYHKIRELLCVKKTVGEAYSMRRVGKSNDGGYMMIYNTLDQSFSQNKWAYSIGICDDVSWDLCMADHGYELFQYDHTIKSLPVKHKSFHWEKIGLTGNKESGSLKHITTLMINNGHDKADGGVLKMDIEGHEWTVFLDTDPEVWKRFDQIVMELHGFVSNANHDAIIGAIMNLTRYHQPVHIHPNNMSRIEYRGDQVMADALEVTLLNKEKFDFVECDFESPTTMDQPCLSRLPEIKLGNWNSL